MFRGDKLRCSLQSRTQYKIHRSFDILITLSFLLSNIKYSPNKGLGFKYEYLSKCRWGMLNKYLGN